MHLRVQVVSGLTLEGDIQSLRHDFLSICRKAMTVCSLSGRWLERLSALAPLGAVLLTTVFVCGCDSKPSSSVSFPDDSAITQALQADFANDPESRQAHELVKQLGGEQGSLQFKITRVVVRQGVHEAHYDAELKLAQDGAESLRQVLLALVPANQNPPDTTLAGVQKWLDEQVRAQEGVQPEQAAALRAAIDKLSKCYSKAQSGDVVPLMTGVRATLLPARDGWYAEKAPSPNIQLRCLPV